MKRLWMWLLTLIVAGMAMAQEPSDSHLTVHVVQRGENLSAIALQYSLPAERIAQLNGISDVGSLAVGQRLLIPRPITSPQPGLTHTVTTGESLNSIAQAYGRTLEELSALNDLANANQIFIGQELVIFPEEGLPAAPEDDDVIDAVSVPSPAVLADFPADFIHEVEAGETVFEIGLRYNLTVTTLARANNLADATRIFIGQELIIPGIDYPRLVGDLPAVVRAFTINPPILIEGHSGRIEIVTDEPVSISGQFLGQDLKPIQLDGGRRHHLLIGVPMFTEQEAYPLRLNLADADGLDAPINLYLQVIGGGYGYQTISINNSELLAADIENEEIALLRRLTSQFNPEKSWVNSLSLPAAAPMNSVFGTRRSYNGSPFNRFHRGVDFAGATGTSVLAAADGTVALAEALNIRGNTTIIDHGWGLYTLYAHQSALHVSPGDSVAVGQVIGAVGATGRSTGPHLHWEVWLNGVNVDPMQWVQETFP